jgi:hypothetical protein
MMIRRIGDGVSPHLVILWTAALLVPRSCRAEWLAEWRSELWYVLQKCDRAGHRSWRRIEGLSFCLGAFRDAVWLRRNNCSPHLRQHLWLQSPLRCLWFLAGAATVTATLFFRSPGHFDTLIRPSQGSRETIFAQFLTIALAVLVLPAVTSLTLGEYPASPHSPARAMRFRRWLFLASKFGLILPIVFCGTFDLAPIVSATGLQPHATLIGYVFAFRWALIDQRRRCPVCLRLLANPAWIGQPAQNFLQWHGTELFCIKGHGLLYVPEIRMSYNTQRWLDLDASWSGLFHS